MMRAHHRGDGEIGRGAWHPGVLVLALEVTGKLTDQGRVPSAGKIVEAIFVLTLIATVLGLFA